VDSSAFVIVPANIKEVVKIFLFKNLYKSIREAFCGISCWLSSLGMQYPEDSTRKKHKL